jgi:thiamine pyrophosphate-dependent acetolactate synthase large subunit-like protein
VVCNNSSYRLLKENLVRYRQDGGEPGPGREFPPCFDVHEPGVDFVALAGALGVPGIQVSKPDEVEPALRAMLDHQGPFLVEVMLDREVS